MYHWNICCRSLAPGRHYTEQRQIWYGKAFSLSFIFSSLLPFLRRPIEPEGAFPGRLDGMGQLAGGGRSICRGQAGRGQLANARRWLCFQGSIDELSTMPTKAGIAGYLEPTRRTTLHSNPILLKTSRRQPVYNDIIRSTRERDGCSLTARNIRIRLCDCYLYRLTW